MLNKNLTVADEKRIREIVAEEIAKGAKKVGKASKKKGK